MRLVAFYTGLACATVAAMSLSAPYLDSFEAEILPRDLSIQLAVLGGLLIYLGRHYLPGLVQYMNKRNSVEGGWSKDSDNSGSGDGG